MGIWIKYHNDKRDLTQHKRSTILVMTFYT